ncbi:transporter substrate-binding domain-containing protein [Blautia liquoris]|uniref:Transporter substrate-binding domain-containing protein n=1 Tax=Blautia liquoris TaxID=2779518 RepID=A0A7M2RL73_9FIRM|nr:transporter substrate-binding domain-containing protein [Blautia liquoris]QOV20821.1 transporter substrate-binding domain-containing protein [Blautia liquoris]
MKNKKKLTALALTVACLMSLGACGNSIPDNSVNSIKDLESGNKKIGVQTGTTGDTISTSDYEKKGLAKVERYNKGADAVQSLKQGKIDCVIIDTEPAKVFVEKNKDLKVLDEPFANEDYAIEIDKSNGKLKEEINAALAELKEDGTLDKIKKNYVGTDSEIGKTPYTSPENVDTSKGTLIMATNAEFPPYEYHEDNKITGIDVDMAQAVADKIGRKLKIEDMDFDSVTPAVTSGKADIGVAGISVTKDRLKNVDFTDSYATSKQVIIVRGK